MAAVYEDVELSWGGETYKVTPTYRMIQQIEQQVSIAGMSGRIAAGDPPMSHIAYVVAFLLRTAGAKIVSPDDVYAEMVSNMTPEEFAHFATIVISGFVPQRAKPGNGDAPAGGAVSKGGARTKAKT